MPGTLSWKILQSRWRAWRTLRSVYFVADMVKSLDTVDKDLLDSVLDKLGLPGWLRMV